MSHNLTPAQAERLVKLQEELNEAGKEVCKILLHGFVVTVDGTTYDNRAALQREAGDVLAAVALLAAWGDLDHDEVQNAATIKGRTITQYMSHQRDAWIQRTAWELLCSDGTYQYDRWEDVDAEVKDRYVARALKLARVREESNNA